MFKKALLISLGFTSLLVGCIGIVIPMLPTTPFLILSSFCFLKSSERINKWFESTKVYNKHLKNFKDNKGMTLKAKLYILIPVYIILLTLFFFKDILMMRITIIVLLSIKTIVFIKIKTIK